MIQDASWAGGQLAWVDRIHWIFGIVWRADDELGILQGLEFDIAAGPVEYDEFRGGELARP